MQIQAERQGILAEHFVCEMGKNGLGPRLITFVHSINLQAHAVDEFERQRFSMQRQLLVFQPYSDLESPASVHGTHPDRVEKNKLRSN